jgi:hypothetical protein
LKVVLKEFKNRSPSCLMSVPVTPKAADVCRSGGRRHDLPSMRETVRPLIYFAVPVLFLSSMP